MGPDTIDRVRRAVTLDASLYQEADQDDGLSGEAILVAALAGAISGLLVWFLGNGSVTSFLTVALGSVIGLFVSAVVLLLIGKLFGGQADYMGLVRSMGYAYAPNALSGIPFIGFVFSIWAFACVVIAVRESHAVSTGIAAVIVLIPAAIVFLLALLVGGLALFALFAA